MIGSRWHPELYELYGLLLASYRDLLGKTMVESIIAVETVQAIILLCFWPLSVDRQLELLWACDQRSLEAGYQQTTNRLCGHV